VLTPEDFILKSDLVNKARLENQPYVVNFPPDEYLASGGQCMAGKSSVHVNADGWLEPCPYSHFASHNLTENPLVDALQSEFFKVIREEFSGKENSSNTCHLFAAQKNVLKIWERTGAESTDKTVSY